MANVPIAALGGLLVHYVCFLLFGTPLLTDHLAEWIMARTPNGLSVWLLDWLGGWAKPFAATGGLAALGAALWAVRAAPLAGAIAAGALWLTGYTSAAGLASFFFPAAALSRWMVANPPSPARRAFLAAAMGGGTALVAGEAFLRERVRARQATAPTDLAPFHPPAEDPEWALARPWVTPVRQFYGMSKNTVDPAPDAGSWRLKVYFEDRLAGDFGYRDLMSLPRTDRWVTLRCISNTLQSNLMGNAGWTGIRFSQLLRPEGDFLEAVVIGADGHSDSFPVEYFLGEEPMLALGMNGRTLDRTHGFPVRLLAPRYYGLKSIKWLAEVRFVRRPYLGTWPRMGYTKEPLIHTCSAIDRVEATGEGLRAAGVAFAGNRGIRAVRVRVAGGPWTEAQLEPAFSPYAWTRWRVLIPVSSNARLIEARAQDGNGNWQAEHESPLFPSGVSGPTIRRVTL